MQQFKQTIIYPVIFFSLLGMAGAAAGAPVINLFPSDVQEHISHTGTMAKDMETALKGIIEKLDTQTKLYREIGCDNSDDPGCLEIKKQIGDHYKEMLEIMESSLPEMKQTVAATGRGIEKRIKKELGRKISPAGIQKLLSGSARPKVVKSRVSLSSRFARYYEMIKAGGGSSIASLASEIYLDSHAVMETIDLMTQEIQRQKMVIVVEGQWGTVTPEMVSMVNTVKEIVFGEFDDTPVLPAMAAGPEAEGTFGSELDMD
ncbi:hypothetical protein [Desulfobacter latus]|uniref:Uncharacterized protein n=1 Tax=Desulfobacter latus TaxID=2292 RepID=A0A850T657_9BACT|nr:hypothetical protein [Desulfobacter latus]NWH06581.1 hypothetical protein [Desulfobacter latus]